MFTAFLVAGSLLTVAWAAAFRHGFGNAPVMIGCFAIACCYGFLLTHELPQLPDPWSKDVDEASKLAWAAIHRAMKLRASLIVVPFVPFFAGLLSVRKLGWLRVVAAIGVVAALSASVTIVEDIKLSSTVDVLVTYALVGSLTLAGLWLLVVFIGLVQSAPRSGRARQHQAATGEP